MKNLSIIIGLFFSLIYTAETIGFNLRGIGSKFNLPSLGYSLHIQFSVVSRILGLIALPVIGFMLDSKVDLQIILLIPISCAIFFIFFCYLFYKNDFCESLIERMFCAYIRKFNSNHALTILNVEKKITLDDERKILISSGLAFFIISLGTFSVFVAATIYPDYRASILQSATVFTSLGTFISTFYLDPKISAFIDSGVEYIPIVKAIYLSRLICMILILLICLGISLTLLK